MIEPNAISDAHPQRISTAPCTVCPMRSMRWCRFLRSGCIGYWPLLNRRTIARHMSIIGRNSTSIGSRIGMNTGR